jgi:lysophospholipase L1-like esterase/uncharacterized cupredoxin-like copper-binding protein
MGPKWLYWPINSYFRQAHTTSIFPQQSSHPLEEDAGWSTYHGDMKYIAPLIMILVSLLLVSCGDHEEHDQSDQPMAMNHGHGGLREAPIGPLAPAKGDHIVFVGNTFAERMAHFGHFETLLQTQYPDHELVVRNLGWSGDTPSLQPRPLDFGTMEEYLVQEQADVIIACFGMNESFSGEAGRSEFEESLRNFIASMRDLKPGGDEPEILLVSPIAHESLGGSFPDGAAHNADLAAYTESMRMVAQEQGVRFADLYQHSMKLWSIPIGPRFTINGIHLTELGNQLISEQLFHSTFDPEAAESNPDFSGADWEQLEPLRAAVVEKNRQFFYRYRPINSYYVMGGRKNPFGVVNFPAEMSKLDAMVAHRDDRVHALAAGRDPGQINDAETGAFTDIESNYAGPEIVFRDPSDTKAGFDIPDGFELQCFASEQDFPELANPVALSFDAQGRLWVLVIPTYPQYLPGVKPEDKLLVLEDVDGDGKADTCNVFAEGLHVPTGFELGDGGVYVAAQPNLLFLQDTDGDGKADTSEVVLHGFGTEDSHHALSAFEWGPGGGLYFQEGTFHHSQVETPHGPVRVKNGAVFRYEPRTGKVRVHISYGFANPWGHVFDDWGQDYVADASGGANYLGANIASKMSYERKHRGVPSFENKGIRPTGGCEVVSSEHLGEALQGDYLLTNVITLRGIRQHNLSDVGSGIKGSFEQDLLVSDDPIFRPCDIQVGPDGALWFVDWYNPLIGHMQHSLRDPNRDHTHGRVWRMVRSDAPLTQVVDVSRMSTPELFAVLEHPERRTRDRARLELRRKPTNDVMAAATTWSNRDGATEHDQLEALWVLQNHDVVDIDHLERVLGSPDPRARAAGVRVLSAWSDRVPETVNLLHAAANDVAPRVRLEAVVAASWLDTLDGAEIALEASQHQGDLTLNHVLEQTMVELASHWTVAMQRGWPYAAANPSAIDDLLGGVSTAELISMQPLPAVERTLVQRADAPVARRRVALEAVSSEQGVTPAEAWLLELSRDDARTAGDSSEPGLLLTSMDSSELQSIKGELDLAMQHARLEPTRRALLASNMLAGGDSLAPLDGEVSEQMVQRWLEAVRLLPEGELRDAANVRAAAFVLDPVAWRTSNDASRETYGGRYVRIDLPGDEPLTLAEVEVFSSGRNVALQAKATQSSEAWGGAPERAIDGDASPSFGSGSQSHTTEGQRDPWWEIDLGSMQNIDEVVIHNRQDEPYWNRIDGYTLTILDEQRGTVWQHADQPASKQAAQHILNNDPSGRIRVAAMQTLADGGSVPWSESLGDAIYALVEPIPMESQDDPVLMAAMAMGDREPNLGQRLAALRVPTIAIAAAPYRMDYDLKEFTVEAGSPVRLVLTNPDDKPHNLVIGSPGSLKAIGRKATLLGTTTKAKARHYVPRMREVLHWIPIVEPHSSAELVFTAPDEPGAYVYVCTYPGHWTTMNGIMNVTTASQ